LREPEITSSIEDDIKNFKRVVLISGQSDTIPVYPIPVDPVEQPPDVTITPSELYPASLHDKIMIVDVNAKLSTGQKVAFELQAHQMLHDNIANAHKNLKYRDVNTVNRLFSLDAVTEEDSTCGHEFQEIPRSFLVNFCDFEIRKDLPKVFLQTVQQCYTNVYFEIFTDATTITIFELTKMKHCLKKKIDDLTGIEAIGLFFKYCGDVNKTKMIKGLSEKWKIFGEAKQSFDLIIGKHGGEIMNISEYLRRRDEQHNFAVLNKLAKSYQQGYVAKIEEKDKTIEEKDNTILKLQEQIKALEAKNGPKPEGRD
jgi:hypothetical protein